MSFLTVQIPLGEVEPMTCKVDQPHGVSAGELLAEAQLRLTELLVHQHKAIPVVMGADCKLRALYPEYGCADASLVHEIQNCLTSIQSLAATPKDRTLA